MRQKCLLMEKEFELSLLCLFVLKQSDQMECHILEKPARSSQKLGVEPLTLWTIQSKSESNI